MIARMLERALRAWTLRHREGGRRIGVRVQHRAADSRSLGGGVVLVAPDVFFPTWDPMQRDTFRRRCSGYGARGGTAHPSAGRRAHWETP